MKINAGTLLKLIPAPCRGTIPAPKALAIVQSIYCGPMTVRGLCSGNCPDCRERLIGAFSLEGARNQQALLTWRLKDALTRAQDCAGAHQTVRKTDRYGLPVPEENPFETLKKQYEAKAKSG